ncbi:MAG: protein kinase [Polyangiaceae bacterium]
MAKVKLLDPSDPRRKLDRYELIGEIATGGMATVFLARLGGVGGFQRFVAIKRLHPHLANEEEFVEMFLDEARLAALIHHPNVVPILEVGVTDAGYYIVMEYVEGDTLSKIVARSMSGGKMVPRPILMRMLLDTLAGLHAAHDLCDDRGQLLGLVHRDVSPQNVLVGVDGSSRITDFGVARATARLTSTGSGKLKGKLAYMAPEQTRGDELDRRTDLFAAGIITWECLVGRRLFKADTEAATLSRILVDPIRAPSSVNSDVPKAFDGVVLRALDREASKRFQNAADMADALEQAAIAAAKGGPEPGIASARDVKAYVQAILGQEIGAQRESVRAWLAQTDSGHAKISMPPRSQRRPRLNSDSELSDVSITGNLSLQGRAPAHVRDSGELPVTEIEPGTPGALQPPLADVTMRFALESSSSSISKARPNGVNGAQRKVPAAKPSQRTLVGQGPSAESEGAPRPPKSVPSLAALGSERDDGDDAVTVMKPSDHPPGEPRAVVIPSVKTARGLFAADLLPAAKAESDQHAGNGALRRGERDGSTLQGVGDVSYAALANTVLAPPAPPVSVNPEPAFPPSVPIPLEGARDGIGDTIALGTVASGMQDGHSTGASSSLTNASMTLPAGGPLAVDATAPLHPALGAPRKSRAPLLLGIVALLGAAGLIVWLLLKPPPSRPEQASAAQVSTSAAAPTVTAAPAKPAASALASASPAPPVESSAPVASSTVEVAKPAPGPLVRPPHAGPSSAPTTTPTATPAPSSTDDLNFKNPYR